LKRSEELRQVKAFQWMTQLFRNRQPLSRKRWAGIQAYQSRQLTNLLS
jgi:hypothetical protein